MAAGDSKTFSDFALKQSNGSYNLGSDGVTLYFVSEQFSTIDENASNPNISGFTVQSGGNFAASYTLANVTNTRAGSITTLDYDNLATIAKNALNPTSIRSALICHTPSGDCYKAVDMTSDGSTPIDVINNDLDYTVNASGSIAQTAV